MIDYTIFITNLKIKLEKGINNNNEESINKIKYDLSSYIDDIISLNK